MGVSPPGCEIGSNLPNLPNINHLWEREVLKNYLLISVIKNIKNLQQVGHHSNFSGENSICEVELVHQCASAKEKFLIIKNLKNLQ